MLKVFTTKKLRDTLTQDELDALVTDFKRYKLTGELPSSFGRDTPYNHPNTPPSVLAAKLLHIHLQDPKSPWRASTIQFKRVSDIAHLVYCQGFYKPDHYALLAILAPDAHLQAKDRNIMLALANDADKFHDEH